MLSSAVLTYLFNKKISLVQEKNNRDPFKPLVVYNAVKYDPGFLQSICSAEKSMSVDILFEVFQAYIY